MITEDFCSFDVAQLLKEKGFDELCIFKYNSEGVRMKSGSAIDEWQNSELDDDECSCVSHQMAMKWLREVHNIYMEIAPTHSVNGPINFIWQTYDSDYLVTGDCDIFYPTYEEAVEAVIKYCLENLI